MSLHCTKLLLLKLDGERKETWERGGYPWRISTRIVDKGSWRQGQSVSVSFILTVISLPPDVAKWLFLVCLWFPTSHSFKCPSTDEWTKKMWHIYTMEYYSAIKRNEIELLVMRWVDLESVITEWSKSEREKQIPYANTYIWNQTKK